MAPVDSSYARRASTLNIRRELHRAAFFGCREEDIPISGDRQPKDDEISQVRRLERIDELRSISTVPRVNLQSSCATKPSIDQLPPK
jgi:hypothetical protein